MARKLVPADMVQERQHRTLITASLNDLITLVNSLFQSALGTNNGLTISRDGESSITLWDTTADTDEKGFRISSEGGVVSVSSVDEDGAHLSTLFQIERVGSNNVATFNFNSIVLSVVPPAFADDVAAAGGGIEIGGIYRTGSALKVRVS